MSNPSKSNARITIFLSPEDFEEWVKLAETGQHGGKHAGDVILHYAYLGLEATAAQNEGMLRNTYHHVNRLAREVRLRAAMFKQLTTVAKDAIDRGDTTLLEEVKALAEGQNIAPEDVIRATQYRVSVTDPDEDTGLDEIESWVTRELDPTEPHAASDLVDVAEKRGWMYWKVKAALRNVGFHPTKIAGKGRGYWYVYQDPSPSSVIEQAIEENEFDL
jgi:hypothetical protein